MSVAFEEIVEMFEKWNIDIQLVYINGVPLLDFTYENESGETVELDGFTNERIKNYSLRFLNDRREK